jgi:regulator of RNase E activity RraA
VADENGVVVVPVARISQTLIQVRSLLQAEQELLASTTDPALLRPEGKT